MQLSARELAILLNGVVEGDPEIQVSRPSKIEEGGVGTITFLGNPKYEEYAYTTTASIILVLHTFQPKKPISATLIRVADVYSAIGVLLNNFGAIQNAPTGIIQDPAGSAIGSGSAPSGGGASGAIYGKFHPLDPIPAIKPGECIFNTAPAGSRLLHTYSPNLSTLGLSPSHAKDCQTALEHIANAYANAYLAANDAAALPGGPLEHVSLLNLSPISAAIFAGPFKYNFGKDSKGNPILHLHPSYTLTALWIAQASLLAAPAPLMVSAIYFYDKAVFGALQEVMDEFLA